MLTYVLCLLQVCYKRRLKTGRLLAASEAQWASVIGYRVSGSLNLRNAKNERQSVNIYCIPRINPRDLRSFELETLFGYSDMGTGPAKQIL